MFQRQWLTSILVLAGSLIVLALFAPAAIAEHTLTLPALPQTKAYLLIEPRSGTELAAHNADVRLPPASLTKLMTAYVLFGDLRSGRLKLDERVTVSRYASRLPGARMFLREGEQVPAESLFQGMLVQSGNDATFALIEHVSSNLPAFVERMNTEAANLGLTNTHFANATGLQNPEHYSSARDLAKIATALHRDFPEYSKWFAQREFTWAGITQPNRNTLLKDPGVNGLKTGHTEAAGFCLIVSATREDQQQIGVLLGLETEHDRTRAGRLLLDFGFRNFETRQVAEAVRNEARVPVWMGASDDASLGTATDLWLTLPKGEFNHVHTRNDLPESLRAPLAAGEIHGRRQWWLGDRLVREAPLVTLAPVAEGNFAQRSADRLRLLFYQHNRAEAAP